MSGILNFTSPSLSFGSTSVSVEPLEKDPQKVPFVAWYVGEKLFYRSDACHCFEELEFFAGKYISKAKKISDKNSLHIKRQLFSFFGEDLTKKILNEMVEKFSTRNGGFTRVTKLGPRRGDASEMAIVELCL